MNITRLRLDNFKRHAALEIELVPGLNVVRGPNEAGKTTIQRAIEMALFRRPTSSSQDLDEARPWSDSDADPQIELDFEDDGAHGSLRKTFAGQRGTVELRLGDESVTDPAAVEAQVARLTGLPSEKFFRATASVHHQELGGLTLDESTLRDRLQQSMSGADRGTHAARRKLEEAIRRYRTEGAKNPGYLKVMRSEVERLREQVKQGGAALTDLERDRRILAETRAARADLDAQLGEQREGVARAERAVSLNAKATEATRRYALFKGAAELRDEVGQLEASHPTSIPLPLLRSTVEQLRNLEFRLSELRAELAAEPDLSGYDVSVVVPRWRPWAIGGGALIVVAVVAAVLGVVANSMVVGIAVAAVLGVVGAFAIWRSVGLRRQLNDIRMQNEMRESEIARRLDGRTNLAERVRQSEQERTEALALVRMTDLATAEAILSAEAEHQSQIGAKKAEYRGMLGNEPSSEDVGILRDKAAAEADECRHALAGMGDLGREPERHLSVFHLAVQRRTPAREAALQAEAQADARVMANEVDAEKVAVDGEMLEAAEESLSSAERRLRIYEDVLATLNGAEQSTMKKAARFLEQRMARDIERITGGRYRRLRVDEATLTFTVFSPETKDWLDVRRLSQGTLDQLYLCARLGIVRQVTQPASPPLVFDDPFITFDDDRARRALALLKDIAREHQVIYLTTSDRYDSLADRVVELPAPTERDVPEAVAAAAGPAETLSMWSNATLPTPVPRTERGNGNGHQSPAAPFSKDEPAVASNAAVEHEPLWPTEEH